MNKLELKNFKAFHNPLLIDIDNKNILLSGENGSGKTSIYEAIKFVFFYDRLERENIPSRLVGDDRVAAISEWKRKYNNMKNPREDFVIKINDFDIKDFALDHYSVFMISGNDIRQYDNIVLSDLIKNAFFTDIDIAALLADREMLQLIIDNVNDILKKMFHECIKIEILQTESGQCRLLDTERNISQVEKLNMFYNEAKLNLVRLLILLEVINAYKKSLHEKSKLLILDDFITSLDASNRIIIIRYILETFTEFQKFIFTHNYSFFNLTRHIINITPKQDEEWYYKVIYEFGGEHSIYMNDGDDKLSEIVEAYKLERQKETPNFESVGNRLRQRFEVLLYELTKLLQIGDLEESKDILSRLIDKDTRHVYLIKDGDNYKNIYDLIDELYNLIHNNSIRDEKLRAVLKKKIEKYKSNDYFKQVLPIIKDMRLYQKVILHQMSHGREALPTMGIKEIEYIIYLINIMEKFVHKQKLERPNVYCV